MTYNSEVSAMVFAKLVNGDAVIEPRLNDEVHRKIRVGDLILFVNGQTQEERLAKVVGLLRFGSFVELFSAYPPDRFGAGSERELMDAVRKFYSSEQEAEHGVLGIKVHILRKG
jgi:ASC-1-like (ASCH) protein